MLGDFGCLLGLLGAILRVVGYVRLLIVSLFRPGLVHHLLAAAFALAATVSTSSATLVVGAAFFAALFLASCTGLFMRVFLNCWLVSCFNLSRFALRFLGLVGMNLHRDWFGLNFFLLRQKF